MVLHGHILIPTPIQDKFWKTSLPESLRAAGVVPSTASTLQKLLLHLYATSSVTFYYLYFWWINQVCVSVFKLMHPVFLTQIGALRWTKLRVVLVQPFLIVCLFWQI